MNKFLRRGGRMVAVFPVSPQPGSTIVLTEDIIVSRERGYKEGEVIQTKYYTIDEITDILKKEFGPQSDTAQLLLMSDPVDGGYVSSCVEAPIGTEVPVRAEPTKWYKFIGWSNGETSEGITITLDGDTMLTALFEELPYAMLELESEPADKYRTLTGGGKFLLGESTILSAIPVAHWHFKEWSDGETERTRHFQITSEGYQTMTAYFEEDPKYYVSTEIMGRGYGDIIGDSEWYYHGEEVSLTVVPDKWSTFVGWNSEGTWTENPFVFEIKSGGPPLKVYFNLKEGAVTADHMILPNKWGQTNPVPDVWAPGPEYPYAFWSATPSRNTFKAKIYTATPDDPEHYQPSPRFWFGTQFWADKNGTYDGQTSVSIDVTYKDNLGRVIEHYQDLCEAGPGVPWMRDPWWWYKTYITPVLEEGLEIELTLTANFYNPLWDAGIYS